MEDKITELTKLWHKIVCTDRHSDEDCHWCIIEIWSYGEKPIYMIEHRGYPYEAYLKKFSSYERAKEFLCQALENAIRKKEKWAKEFILKGNEHNRCVAKEILKVIDEYKKSN